MFNFNKNSLILPRAGCQKEAMQLPRENLRSVGFTLLETIIALGILSFVMMGPLTLSSKSLSTATSAQNQTTAFFLAEEGLELVRNIRDNNNASNRWLGLEDCITTNGCYIDAFVGNVSGCGVSCPPLKYDTNDWHYNYSSGDDYIFTRKISMVEVSLGDETEYSVISTVSWQDKNGEKSVSLQTNLFDLTI